MMYLALLVGSMLTLVALGLCLYLMEVQMKKRDSEELSVRIEKLKVNKQIYGN